MTTIWKLIDWVEQLPLPDRLALLLMLIAREADKQAVALVHTGKLSLTTRFDQGEIDKAITDFLHLELLEYLGEETKGRATYSRYRICEGVEVGQLSLGMHGIISAIQADLSLNDAEQLALERLAVQHYDWMTGIATVPKGPVWPRWTVKKSRQVVQRLVRRGYLVRKQMASRSRPHKYELHVGPSVSPPTKTDAQDPGPRKLTRPAPPLPAGNKEIAAAAETARLLEALTDEPGYHDLAQAIEQVRPAGEWHESWAARVAEEWTRVRESDARSDVAVMIHRLRLLTHQQDVASLLVEARPEPKSEPSAPLPVVEGPPDPRAVEVWQKAMDELKLSVPKPSYDTWVHDTEGHSLNGGVLTVLVPNTFIGEMLERRMYSVISQAVEAVMGTGVEVQFATRGE